MRLQHPRATDAFKRGPPSRTAVPTGSGSYATLSVDDSGYMDVPDQYADAAMDGLESSYEIEYDRETGDIVGTDPDSDPDSGGDDPPDEDDNGGDDVEAGAEDEDGTVEELPEPDDLAVEDDQDGDDLEAWANWNEEDWLSLSWGDRQDDVEDGLVDEHLGEIIEIETSSNVREAAEERLEELESE